MQETFSSNLSLIIIAFRHKWNLKQTKETSFPHTWFSIVKQPSLFIADVVRFLYLLNMMITCEPKKCHDKYFGNSNIMTGNVLLDVKIIENDFLQIFFHIPFHTCRQKMLETQRQRQRQATRFMFLGRVQFSKTGGVFLWLAKKKWSEALRSSIPIIMDF